MSTETKQKVVQYLIEESAKDAQVLRVILFGSRARGDAQERSDFDIAVETLTSQWARTWDHWTENIPTLCSVDLIHLNTLKNKELVETIHQEGKVIYERPQT